MNEKGKIRQKNLNNSIFDAQCFQIQFCFNFLNGESAEVFYHYSDDDLAVIKKHLPFR